MATPSRTRQRGSEASARRRSSTATSPTAGSGVGVAASGDDDTPLRGDAFERATRAALQHVGGGTVVETEAGDDGAAYGVEVRLDDGRIVEVSLNDRFEVTGTEADDDGAEDESDDPDA